MKARITIAAAVLAVGLLQAPTVQAQARSLEDLLRLVEQGRATDNAEARKREADFNAKQGDQQRLLGQARAKRTAEERRSGQLETSYEANEIEIADVTEQLNVRLGSLRELFGNLQTVSGDAQGRFNNSLTNIEYPDRGEFLGALSEKMGSSSKLASIEEIERLWFELQREATELGKVKLLKGFTVFTKSGEEEARDIVRIGSFNLVSDGKYLQYNTDTDRVSELQRQPDQARFTNSAEDLVEATQGMVAFGLDPTSGQLLGNLVNQPNLQEQVAQGAEVGYLIIALGILGVLLSLERLVTLGIAGNKVKAQLKSDTPSSGNALGRVLKVYHDNKAIDTETLELKLGEAILKETPALQRSLLFIKIISVVAPLMGLLGTVTGMIKTFQAITLFGTGDPKIMAGGISQALVTTVLGLCVAIPMVLLHTLVSGRSKRIVHTLQEQSAGIIAEHSERQH